MIHQTNLFNTDPQVAGFKLDYMEVWNWGTFNDKIYRMSPYGNNSLLTGANASGKSTLIDALLTLLVPQQRKRFYNQSSGTEKKGNRTDITYIFLWKLRATAGRRIRCYILKAARQECPFSIAGNV